jgi:DNA replication and repair protein RecF
MGFEAVRLFNFRNLLDGEIPLGARRVFLVGENGQGKTNLLEAIYLLAFASSFRDAQEAALPRDPAGEVALGGAFRSAAGDTMALSLRIPPGGKKEIRVDGKLLAERRDLLGQVLCICFVQQDMQLVDGPPEARRRFFDQTLVLSEPGYLETLRDYRRVLRARNFVLKSRQADLLDVYDSQLAPLGLRITARRSAMVQEFNAVFSPMHREIAGGEVVEIRYWPSWRALSSQEQALEVLVSSRGRELGLGTTTTGPHRDGFHYARGGADYTRYASTGQLRLCALALRVAQARFLAARTGKKPVLLLDDVLLELDPGRKRSFISRFPPYEQAFFTFLPDENYLQYRGEDTLLLSVRDGGFTR